MEQPWNEESVRLVSDTLAPYFPTVTEILTAEPSEPLTPGRVEEFVRSTMARAQAEGCEFVVWYYVGHMLVNAGQQLALLQGGASDDEIAMALPKSAWPASDESDAFLPLAQVHRTMSETGLPFLLLVDGCMESEVVKAKIGDGGFQFDPMQPGSLTYTGPKELISSSDVRAITDAQRDFGGTQPYLRSTNAVAFAAKPGTFATPRPNPFVVGGAPVAPLAEYLHRWAGLFQMRDGALPPLKLLLDRVVGFRGVGEIGMSGGISWSDFTKMDAITSRIRPEGFLSRADPAEAVVERLPFDGGTIEDYTRDPATGSWYLQVKTVEPSGRNRWDIWECAQSQNGQAAPDPKRVVADIVFPKLAFGGGTLFLYSDDTYQLTRLRPGQAAAEKLPGEWSFRELTPGFEAGSVLGNSADNTVEKGGDTLLRLGASKAANPVLTAELTQARCMVETAPGSFAWLDGDRPGMVQISDRGNAPRDQRIAVEELGALATIPSGLVAMNWERTRIYRVNRDGRVDSAWLSDTEDRPLVRYPFGYGGLRSFGGQVWLAGTEGLLRLDLEKLHWESSTSTP